MTDVEKITHLNKVYAIVIRDGIKWIDLEHFGIRKSEEECMKFLYNCLKNE